eukprot:2494819-Pleurochrysis_carterae.AAC.1
MSASDSDARAPSESSSNAAPPKPLDAAAPCVSVKLDAEGENELSHSSPAPGGCDARGVWPIVSLITNVVFLTAAVTAGMMHALSSNHGGHLPLRALALASTGVAYIIATCTAAFF